MKKPVCQLLKKKAIQGTMMMMMIEREVRTDLLTGVI